MDPSQLLLTFLGGFAGLAAAGGLVALAVRHARRRWQRWERVGDRHGLLRTKRGFWKTDALVGSIDGVALVVDTYTQSHGETTQSFTRVTADAADLHPELQVSKEGLLKRFAKRVWSGADVQVGDVAFDDAVLLRGPEDHILAALDAATRAGVQRRLVFGAGAEVKNGQVLVVTSGVVRDPQELEAMLLAGRDQALALAVSAAEVPLRLGANAGHDPLGPVRVRCLQVLAARHPDHPATRPALDAGLADPDPAVRLLAASRLPGRVVDHLPQVGDEAVLVGLLGHELPAIVGLAVGSLGLVGTVAAVVPLQAMLASGPYKDDLRSPVREAVSRIQERAGGGGQGALAVVEPPAGPVGGLQVVEGLQQQGSLTLQEADDASLSSGRDRDREPT